jgi:hypothetical protein
MLLLRHHVGNDLGHQFYWDQSCRHLLARLRHLMVNDKEILALRLDENLVRQLNLVRHLGVDLVVVLQNLDGLNRDVNQPSVVARRDVMDVVLVVVALVYCQPRMDCYLRAVGAASSMQEMEHQVLAVLLQLVLQVLRHRLV